MSDAPVKDAFKQVRQGRSPEFVICDRTLGSRFLSLARSLGVEGSDAEINRFLLNLRKENKLQDCPTTARKKSDPNRKRYLNAVSSAVRFVERQFAKNVDEVICDPDTRSQFDALVEFMCPGTPAFEAEYAALSLRKANRLKPEPVGHVIRTTGGKILAIAELESQLSGIPACPGVYIFFDETVTLYAGKADSLRRRIGDHIETWTFREIIQQIKEKRRAPVFVVYHVLDVAISARELAAYETELIRSRNPEHNRASRIRGES